jgi:hypothetical protein
MPQGKIAKKDRSRWFNTTVGEFVEAVYEVAMEEYMDEVIARRIAMQMLIRKLRLQHKLRDAIEKDRKIQVIKNAYLRHELEKRKKKQV